MQGTVVQINISPGGLPKRAIPRGVVTRRGVTGDDWAHPKYHGGPDQALLLICQETIDELVAKNYSVFPGALGENLTVHGLDRRLVRVGQRFRIRDVIFEITKTRTPCSALDVYGAGIRQEIYDHQVKAGDPASARWGASGFYARVIQGGEVLPQDTLLLLDQAV